MIAEDWGNISKEAKNLILKMLERDPNKRISALGVLNDLWLLKNVSTVAINNKSVEKLMKF